MPLQRGFFQPAAGAFEVRTGERALRVAQHLRVLVLALGGTGRSRAAEQG